jgi:signal transduction histidine kinase
MLAASVLLCLGTMVLIKVGESQKRTSTQELFKSHQVLDQAINLYANLQDAETEQAGYILTGESQYKVEYREAVDQIDERVQALVELTVMSPPIQGIMVHSLIPKIIEYKTDLSEGIRIFEESGREAAIEYILEGYSFSLKDEIRHNFMDLKLLEGNTLGERIQSLEMAYNIYNYIAYAGLIFIGLSIVFGIYLIRDYDQQKNELIRDITRSNDELARLNKQEVALREEKDRFLGMAAHDLRSPLNAIIALADILKLDSENQDEDHKEYVDYIIESANQMNTLINNFLDVHRNEEGKKQVKPEKVDISSLLKALLFKFENRAKQKDISIALDYQLDSDFVITDKSIFSQVVDNLISNAVKFSPKGKNVFVRLKKSDTGFNLEVEDEGYGIKESEKSKLFRKYQTLSVRPTGGEKSVGLGLSIVYDQMTLIGGEITCESKEGEGATFIARFPDMEDLFSRE